MNYKLEKKEITFDERKQKRIGTGKTGDVYQYGSDALKIFNKDEKVIDEETARYLSSIRTSRVLLPKKLLFYKNKFKGYTMKLVSQKPRTRNIISIPTQDLINNIELLEEDVSKLSSKKILLNGMTSENTIFNGNLYITDPSKYTIFETSEIEELDSLNQFQLSILLNSILVRELNKIQAQYPGANELKRILDAKNNETEYSEFLEEVVADSPNVKTLVKRLK